MVPSSITISNYAVCLDNHLREHALNQPRFQPGVFSAPPVKRPSKQRVLLKLCTLARRKDTRMYMILNSKICILLYLLTFMSQLINQRECEALLFDK